MTEIIVRLRSIEDDFTEEEQNDFLEPSAWGNATACAERGAKFLDRVMPGWEHRVELNELDLASTCSCVLGQLFKPVSNQLLSLEDLTAEEFTQLQELGTSRDIELATLAQVARATNGYGIGSQLLSPLTDESEDVGTGAEFMGFDYYTTSDGGTDYFELTKAWSQLIAERLGVEDPHESAVRTLDDDDDYI